MRVTRVAASGAAVVMLAASCAAGISSNPGAQHREDHRHILIAADSSQPAAGICAENHRRYVEVDLVADVPSPRCWQVRPRQSLRVHNATRTPARVHWRPYAAVTVDPGDTVTFGGRFGAYLQPGDHDGRVSIYAGGGFQIYLPARHHRPPAVTSAG